VTQYHSGKIGHPVAVGRMAVSGETLQRAEERDVKGKAVYVLHTWRDTLWDMGVSKAMDVPEPRNPPSHAEADSDEDGEEIPETSGQTAQEALTEQSAANGNATSSTVGVTDAVADKSQFPTLTAEGR